MWSVGSWIRAWNCLLSCPRSNGLWLRRLQRFVIVIKEAILRVHSIETCFRQQKYKSVWMEKEGHWTTFLPKGYGEPLNMKKSTCMSMLLQKRHGSNYETTCSFTIISACIKHLIIVHLPPCTLPLSHRKTMGLEPGTVGSCQKRDETPMNTGERDASRHASLDLKGLFPWRKGYLSKDTFLDLTFGSTIEIADDWQHNEKH